MSNAGARRASSRARNVLGPDRARFLRRTHEIGFSKRALVRELRAAGYGNVKVLRPRLDNWVSPIWITARKP